MSIEIIINRIKQSMYHVDDPEDISVVQNNIDSLIHRLPRVDDDTKIFIIQFLEEIANTSFLATDDLRVICDLINSETGDVLSWLCHLLNNLGTHNPESIKILISNNICSILLTKFGMTNDVKIIELITMFCKNEYGLAEFNRLDITRFIISRIQSFNNTSNRNYDILTEFGKILAEVARTSNQSSKLTLVKDVAPLLLKNILTINGMDAVYILYLMSTPFQSCVDELRRINTIQILTNANATGASFYEPLAINLWEDSQVRDTRLSSYTLHFIRNSLQTREYFRRGEKLPPEDENKILSSLFTAANACKNEAARRFIGASNISYELARTIVNENASHHKLILSLKLLCFIASVETTKNILLNENQLKDRLVRFVKRAGMSPADDISIGAMAASILVSLDVVTLELLTYSKLVTFL